MAQQARPNCAGQMAERRAHWTTFSNRRGEEREIGVESVVVAVRGAHKTYAALRDAGRRTRGDAAPQSSTPLRQT